MKMQNERNLHKRIEDSAENRGLMKPFVIRQLRNNEPRQVTPGAHVSGSS
jgi:hypothetical protein